MASTYKDIEYLWKDKTVENAKLISVQWLDIRNVSRWNDETEDVRPARQLHTAGWLLYEGLDPADPEMEIVVVAATWDGEEESWHDITAFPKRAFRRINHARVS